MTESARLAGILLPSKVQHANKACEILLKAKPKRRGELAGALIHLIESGYGIDFALDFGKECGNNALEAASALALALKKKHLVSQKELPDMVATKLKETAYDKPTVLKICNALEQEDLGALTTALI